MTNRKAPESVMRDLCDAVDREFRDGNATADVREALAAYREATAPLRSGAVVDAEIARLTRECVENEWAGGEDDYERWERVTALCREPTSGSSSAPAAKESRDNAGVSAGPANEDEPEECGCDEANALKFEVERLRLLTEDKHAPNTLEWRKLVDELRQEIHDLRRELRGCQASLAGRTIEAKDASQKLLDIQTEWDLWRTEKKNGYAALVSIGSLLRCE